MITICKIKDSVIQKGIRILKVLQFGAKTAREASSFGDDSNPLKNMTAIYADTGEAGESIIIGYINKSQLADTGEKRIYSLKSDGSISFFMWLKNDGTCQIGGNADNMVRFSKLDEGLQTQKDAINVELTKIQAAISGLGGVYSRLDIDVDINDSKIDEIKTL